MPLCWFLITTSPVLTITWLGVAKFCVNFANWFTFTLANDVVNGEKFIFESWNRRQRFDQLRCRVLEVQMRMQSSTLVRRVTFSAFANKELNLVHTWALARLFCAPAQGDLSHLKVVLIVIHHARFWFLDHLESYNFSFRWQMLIFEELLITASDKVLTQLFTMFMRLLWCRQQNLFFSCSISICVLFIFYVHRFLLFCIDFAPRLEIDGSIASPNVITRAFVTVGRRYS